MAPMLFGWIIGVLAVAPISAVWNCRVLLMSPSSGDGCIGVGDGAWLCSTIPLVSRLRGKTGGAADNRGVRATRLDISSRAVASGVSRFLLRTAVFVEAINCT